ncbi:hypothetical protein PV325_009109 [Microctonus aethiopoides]|nr:hypothetical protein PV325_009109 [Microctonus aethiopoides]
MLHQITVEEVAEAAEGAEGAEVAEMLKKISGVAAYISGHYFAYCRRLGGNWQVYNDLSIKPKSASVQTDVEAHAVYYVLEGDRCVCGYEGAQGNGVSDAAEVAEGVEVAENAEDAEVVQEEAV